MFTATLFGTFSGRADWKVPLVTMEAYEGRSAGANQDITSNSRPMAVDREFAYIVWRPMFLWVSESITIFIDFE